MPTSTRQRASSPRLGAELEAAAVVSIGPGRMRVRNLRSAADTP
jgi:hypothetical protein